MIDFINNLVINVRGYINRSRRDGTMPPPTQLNALRIIWIINFVECMQYYGDNYPEKMTIKMDMALDEFHQASPERTKKET